MPAPKVTSYGKPRQYKSLLTDRFDITKVIRIERSADENDIAN